MTILFLLVAANVRGVEFDVSLDAAVADRPYSGRLYVFLTQRAAPPMHGPDWFRPEPFCGLQVQDMQPGQAVRVDDRADCFPAPVSQLPPGEYRVQAVLDHDLYSQHHARGAGNFYCQPASLVVTEEMGQPVSLLLDTTIEPQPFPETEWVQEVVLESPLLSEFHGRPFVDRAAVVLPASYFDQPERRYPAIYSVPGFSGDHREALGYPGGGPPAGEGETEFIRVFLSGQCKWGHHVYADSAANGPRGQALIAEMIPEIDRRFRTVAAPTARFVTGHSSGGWSCLWLQVNYPQTFGGVWSTSPDPVDFRDYQEVDLYADPPQSLYVNQEGGRRPIARWGETPVLWYDSFGKMDDCLGRGGQLRSFEAVFSPLGEDGAPLKLWDRQTGRIEPHTARLWEAYDIRLVLERNWSRLGPQLAGKLHIITGELDTFYLEGAVEKLGATLTELGSDAVVEIVPGADHGNLLTSELFTRFRREMTAAYLEHHPE